MRLTWIFVPFGALLVRALPLRCSVPFALWPRSAICRSPFPVCGLQHRGLAIQALGSATTQARFQGRPSTVQGELSTDSVDKRGDNARNFLGRRVLS